MNARIFRRFLLQKQPQKVPSGSIRARPSWLTFNGINLLTIRDWQTRAMRRAQAVGRRNPRDLLSQRLGGQMRLSKGANNSQVVDEWRGKVRGNNPKIGLGFRAFWLPEGRFRGGGCVHPGPAPALSRTAQSDLFALCGTSGYGAIGHGVRSVARTGSLKIVPLCREDECEDC